MTTQSGLSVDSVVKQGKLAGTLEENDLIRRVDGEEYAIADITRDEYDGVMVKIKHSGSQDATIVTGETHVLVTNSKSNDNDVDWIEARLLSPFHKIAEPKGETINTRFDIVEHDLTSVSSTDASNEVINFTVGGSEFVLVNSMIIKLGY